MRREYFRHSDLIDDDLPPPGRERLRRDRMRPAKFERWSILIVSGVLAAVAILSILATWEGGP